MPITLAEWAVLAPSPLKRGVIDVFRRESFIMDHISWEKVDNLAVQQLRTAGLPTSAFRRLNEAWAESHASFEPVTERVFDLGGRIDFDVLLDAVDSKQRAVHTDAYVTSFAYTFNDFFINGSPAVDPDGFTGIRFRLNEFLPAVQTVLGAGLDISADAVGLAANFETYLDALDQMIHQLDGHIGNLLLTNEQAYRRTNSALRQLDLWDTTTDRFGRKVVTYGPGGPMVKDLGLQANGTTQIMGNLENVSGDPDAAAGTSSSVYAVRTGEKYLMGIYLYPMKVTEIGLLESGIAKRTVVDWPVGIRHVNPRALARLVGLQIT